MSSASANPATSATTNLQLQPPPRVQAFSLDHNPVLVGRALRILT
jgi:hypothetical protein